MPVVQNNIKSISYKTNFSEQIISSDTGVENCITGNSNNSWNLTIKSPSVINDSIFTRPEYYTFKNSSTTSSGAEVAIHVELNSAVRASRIRVSPNVGDGLSLIQTVLIRSQSNTNNPSSDQNNFIPLMTDALFSNKNIDINFPEQEIKGFILFFKQKKYKRTKLSAQQSELNAKMVNYIVKKLRSERKQNHDMLQDYVFNFFLKDFNRDFVLKNKNIYSYNYNKYYPVRRKKDQVSILKLDKKDSKPSDIDNYNRFKNSDVINNIVFSIVSFSLGSRVRSLNPSTYLDSTLRSTLKSVNSYLSGGIIPVGDSNNFDNNAHFSQESASSFDKNSATQAMNNVEPKDMYEYMFSIKNIALMATANNQNNSRRSFYVSKRLPLDARPMSVKAIYNVVDNNIGVGSSNYIGSTSLELSVSVKENPEVESDWMPILPYDLNQIDSELLIFGSNTRVAQLRFIPLTESVIIYKNGSIIPTSEFSVTGSSVTLNTRDNSAVYVAKYRPLNLTTAKEVQLFSRNLSAPVLSTASSSGQSGEYFNTVNYDLSVQLSKSPYIDRSKLVGGSYNAYMGTITSANTSFGNYDYSSYSPVKVVFDDNTSAINLTNYLLDDNSLPTFPDDINTIYFVHYDNIIIFNRKPTKPFRVMYQYLPDIFRYRVIFRSLNSTQENSSLDRIIFKFSGFKENSMSNKFIRYDNIFRKTNS